MEPGGLRQAMRECGQGHRRHGAKDARGQYRTEQQLQEVEAQDLAYYNTNVGWAEHAVALEPVCCISDAGVSEKSTLM